MFHGSMVALVTPLKDQETVDFDALATLIDWHISEGTHALVPMGTTGEAGTLPPSQQGKVIRFVVEQAKERCPVIAGTYATATDKAIELTHAAIEAGADASLIMTPAYIKPSQNGLIAHYQQIAQAVAIPVILYNVPSRTACDLLPETIAELAAIPNIVGVKEATGSVNRLLAIKELCGDAIDVYSGDDLTARMLMSYGAKGVISVTANVAPGPMAALAEAALAGNLEHACEIDQRLNALHRDLFVEANPIPVKWVLHQLGFIDNQLRLPLTPLADEYHARLREAMGQAGLAAKS